MDSSDLGLTPPAAYRKLVEDVREHLTKKQPKPMVRRATKKDIRETQILIKPLWTGVHIYIGPHLLGQLEGGALGAEAFAVLIGAGLKAASGAFTVALVNMFGPLSQAIAIGVFAKIAEFFAMDKLGGGKGVWIPITWIQFPALTLPGTAAVYIHPLPANTPLNPWGLGPLPSEDF